jgi:CRP/FNR family transcriptional regulator, cyclic AMP receptor protein
MKTTDAIKQSFIFSSLDDQDLLLLSRITREKRFDKGSVIMQEGEQGDTMYVVVEGEVGVSKSLTMKFGDNDFRQTEKVLTSLKAEDHVVIGEMALIGQDSRSASIVARTDCLFLEINREDFIKLVEAESGLGIKILMRLSELLISRLRQSNQDIVRLTTALSIALSK